MIKALARLATESLPEAGPDARVLLLTPTGRDAAITQSLLASAGIQATPSPDFHSLIEELHRGAAAVLISEESLSAAHNTALHDLLTAQPAWSDLPILLLTYPGADSQDLREAIPMLGNVTLIERPVRVATLISTVRTALRARDRQYQIRGYLEERARTEQSLRIADRRKDEFLATLGHELRNPLAPLQTAVQLLKVAGLQHPTVVYVGGVMERQVGNLIRLVDDLLQVSRITRGLIDVQRAPLDLGAVIRGAIETSRPVIEAAGHQLTVALPDEPVTVQGDAVRLMQVFSNLLTNAAKYTNAGGRIRVTARVRGSRAIVSVRDDGIGIPESQLESVFDMFTQVDRAERRSQGGLGIGLTLVRSLVQLHGGRVEARSAGPGTGSEFVVELPARAGPYVSTGESPLPGQLPPQRILIVDDNRDAADTLGELLSTLGATITVVHTGRAALDAVDSFRPHTVLMDIGMPEMNGYEVSRKIRASGSHGDVTLVALSGWGQEHDRRRSRAAGFDHHLIKPPDIEQLHRILTDRADGT